MIGSGYDRAARRCPLEYRHLRFFLALAEELHFTRAARRLSVAQPHLSQEIRKLEQELKAQLFERTRRHVALTEAGRAFQAQAVRIMAMTDEARRAAARAADGTIGRLHVGFAGSAGYDVVPKVVRRFAAAWPEVELVLHEMHTLDQVGALRDERIHIGFMRREVPEGSGLVSRIVRREALMLAVPSGHRLARRPVSRFEDLARERWIVFDRSSTGLHRDLLAAAGEAGFEPLVAQEAGEIPTLINLVAGGLGIALVPASVALLRRAGVVYRPLRSVRRRAVVVAAWRPSPPPVLRNFVQVLERI